MSFRRSFLFAGAVDLATPPVWLHNGLKVMLPAVALVLTANLVFTPIASAQGGGNANAVGQTLEAATQAAGEASSKNSAAAGSSSGPPAGTSTSGSPASPMSGAPNAIGSYGPPDSSGYSGDPSSSYDPSGYDPSGYGGGDSGYGMQSAAGNPVQRVGIAVSAFSQQLSKSIAAFLGPTASEAEVGSRQLTLWEQAALTFYRGDQRRALSLYHAHMIADGDAASEARSAVMYSRFLKRPVWLVRFGISIHPRVPAEFADDPQPIREDTRIASANSRLRGAANRGGEESYGGPPDEFTGDQSGSMDPASMGESDGSGFGNPVPKPVVMTLGGAASEQAKVTIDRNLGIVADVTSELFGALYKAGKFGNAFASMEAKGAQLAAASQEAGDLAPSDLPMWIPGVDFVGEGAYTEMIGKAKASEIDVLMHFDIIVKENRVGPPQYTTRCRLFHVDSGDTIVISKAIDKYEIASKAASNRESIHEIMKAMFDIAEKKLAVEPMPALQPVHAASRIEALLASKKPDSLRNLAEIVMFRSRDLVTAEDLDKAFYFAGNDGALQLIHDAEAQRYQRAVVMIDQELSTQETP
ncbi:MAG: hypothetical protein ACO1RT_16780 [Planctomycetaceae bacterium]